MSGAENTAAAADGASEASVTLLVNARGESRDPFQHLPAEIRDEIFSCVESYRDLRSITGASPAMRQRSLGNPVPKAFLFCRLRSDLGSRRRFHDAYLAHQTATLRNSGRWAEMHLRALLCRPGGNTANGRALSDVDEWGLQAGCKIDGLAEMNRFYRSVVRPRAQELGGTADYYEYVSSLYRFEIWCNYYGSGKYAVKRRKPSRYDLRTLLTSCLIHDQKSYNRLVRVSRMIGDVYRGLLDRFILLHEQQSDNEGGQDPRTVLERPEWFAHIRDSRFASYIREAMVSRGLNLFYDVITDVPEGRALDEIVKREVAIALRGFDVKDSSLGLGLHWQETDWQKIWPVAEQLELRGVNRFDTEHRVNPWD